MMKEASEAASALQAIVRRLTELGYGDQATAITGLTSPIDQIPVVPVEPSIRPPDIDMIPQLEPDSAIDPKWFNVPLDLPENAYGFMMEHIMRANFGRVKGKDGEYTNSPIGYVPHMVAKGSAMDPGTVVPAGALRSEESFVKWTQSVGYTKYVSLEVQGANKAVPTVRIPPRP